jgi:outer membrane protein assembly factor BamB
MRIAWSIFSTQAMRIAWFIVPALALLTRPAVAADAVDWPAYLHDSTRSGATSRSLPLTLSRAWVFQPRHAPRPAWPAPASQDPWNKIRELKPVVTYDRAYHTVIAGGRLYFATSSNDKVYCLDAVSGEIQWTFFTDGPVRLAPTIADGKVYVGSDDGAVYCLDAKDGGVHWTFRPDTPERMIPGNGRLISFTPVRTGVVVEDGVAYFFAGLFPSYAVHGYAIDAVTGEPLWSLRTEEVSPQGYLVASPTRLFVPTGRTTPAVFDRSDGSFHGKLEGGGGAFAVLVDGVVASGPGIRYADRLELSDPGTQEIIATCDGMRMVADGPVSYTQTHTELMALDRSQFLELGHQRNALEKERENQDDLQNVAKRRGNADAVESHRTEVARLEREIAALDEQMAVCYMWRVPCAYPYALILAGDVLIAGGDDEVAAFRASDGRPFWKAPVSGRAYGLSVAQQRLYVSTDSGAIHCFASTELPSKRIEEVQKEDRPFPDDALSAVYARAADVILRQTDIRQGYCVVLDCGEGRLAYELARRSDLRIIGLERDPDKVLRAREALDATGLYGVRVSVRVWEGDSLPFTSWFANLVVSDAAVAEGVLPKQTKEVYRILRPYGGTAMIGSPGIASAAIAPVALTQWMNAVEADSHTIIQEDGEWVLIRRGDLPGGGEWTQLYANAGHTASSNDEIEGPVTVQWFGEPGPRGMVDRHRGAMSSLSKAGRLFVPGQNRIFVLDAYNGSPLWELNVSGLCRITVLENSGHMLLTDDLLYVAAENECWGVRVENGERALTFSAPLIDDAPSDWGYLNQADDLLIGSGQQPRASINYSRKEILMGAFRQRVLKPLVPWMVLLALATGMLLLVPLRGNGEETGGISDGVLRRFRNRTRRLLIVLTVIPLLTMGCYAILIMVITLGNLIDEGAGNRMVTSRYLFALDRYTGAERWRYQNGELLNTAISVADGRLFFVECRNPETIFDSDGRIASLQPLLASNTFLVALDVVTGAMVWETPVSLPFHYAMYANGANNVLLLSGSYREEDKLFYRLFGFDMQTGTLRWNTRFRARNTYGTDWAGKNGAHGDHGDIQQHPVIVGDTVYARPYAFNLQTGEQLDYVAYRGGHGCGRLTGSAHYLYGRGDNPRIYPTDVSTTEGAPLTTVSRPGCSLNIIPAGGLILVPESSAGCTCSYPLQTSFGFIPEASAGP